MKVIRFVIKLIIGIIILLGGIGLLTLTLPDKTHYQDSTYFEEWKKIKQNFQTNFTPNPTDTLQVGWAKVNITPKSSGPMAGYGKRRGKHYENVLDSVYVRALVFQSGNFKTALVSADLLIIPPTVLDQLQSKLSPTDIPLNNIFFGATHTHNSVGGWGKGISTLFFSGPYNPEVEVQLAEAFLKAVREAERDLQVSSISYQEIPDTLNINNRLVGKEGCVDGEIRAFKVKREDGKTAEVVSYSAHSTVLNSKTMLLSRDWPGLLVDSLENQPNTFGMYLAGAVGSMSPNEIGKDDFDELKNQANGVWNVLKSKNTFTTDTTHQLFAATLPLPLGDARPRLTKHLALKSWAFNWALGESNNFIKFQRIGNILLVGVPCDFSGELIKSLDDYAAQKGLNLLVTSFNGGYTGYVTHDKWYDLDKYETVTMNWYGPYKGAYYQEVIRDIIDLMNF